MTAPPEPLRAAPARTLRPYAFVMVSVPDDDVALAGPLTSTLSVSATVNVLLPFTVGWLKSDPMVAPVPVPVRDVVPVKLNVPGVLVVPMYWAPEAEAMVGAVPTANVKAEEPLCVVLVSKVR